MQAPVVKLSLKLIDTYNHINQVYYQKQKEVLKRALAIYEHEYGPGHAIVVETLEDLRTAARHLGQGAERRSRSRSRGR